jgi:hypothetical protein
MNTRRTGWGGIGAASVPPAVRGETPAFPSPRSIRWFRHRRPPLRGYVELAPMQPTTPPDCRPYQTELRTFVAAEPWPLGTASSEVRGPFLTACVEPLGQSRSPSFFESTARVEALRSSGFCCPRLLHYHMASSDFPRGVATHFGLRLIGPLTAAEFPPTTRDLDRSLTLPSVHAVAQNTGDDGCFSSLRIHSRCCLRPYTGGSTIPFPNSPSDTRSRCHDGAIHSLFPFGCGYFRTTVQGSGCRRRCSCSM